MSGGAPRTGGCLCGAVRYRVGAPLRPTLTACHCSQCRRQHGALGVFTAAPAAAVEIEGEDKLRWYRSSAAAERGFCSVCGSKLFWREIGGENLDFAAGSLDETTGLRLSSHIYVASQGDYYEIGGNLPKFPGSGRG